MQQKVNRPMQDREIVDQLVENGIDMAFLIRDAFVSLVRATPFLIIGYLLFIAPNC